MVDVHVQVEVQVEVTVIKLHAEVLEPRIPTPVPRRAP